MTMFVSLGDEMRKRPADWLERERRCNSVSAAQVKRKFGMCQVKAESSGVDLHSASVSMRHLP